ncbi:MAG TPA: adenosylcobinamide-GDP ribazoletransferase [Ferrovibrio sp.]|jgi:adenosylcobinamide-GDP ribazoletransferase|uniref:adenosylcobinamide-GDP ribazoletransferase n=1 Tax=Ferrovibrio sp. TaxID=1917215 RepID=UPI002ED155C6
MSEPEQDQDNQPSAAAAAWPTDIPRAFRLLTRLPLPGKPGRPELTGRAVWAFPLVGVVIGLGSGLVFLLTNQLGIGVDSATLLAIVTQIVLTGGLHEDGLADTADGFGGGTDRERKLAIMRDSRIGTYGVLALILALGLRFTTISELANSLISTSDDYDQSISQASAVVITLIAASALSRAAMAIVWYALPPARTDGLAASSGRVPLPSLAICIAIAALAAFLLLPAPNWMISIGCVAIAALLMAVLAKWQIGGHTGDVLGATQQIVEIAILLAISATTIAI